MQVRMQNLGSQWKGRNLCRTEKEDDCFILSTGGEMERTGFYDVGNGGNKI